MAAVREVRPTSSRAATTGDDDTTSSTNRSGGGSAGPPGADPSGPPGASNALSSSTGSRARRPGASSISAITSPPTSKAMVAMPVVDGLTMITLEPAAAGSGSGLMDSTGTSQRRAAPSAPAAAAVPTTRSDPGATGPALAPSTTLSSDTATGTPSKDCTIRLSGPIPARRSISDRSTTTVRPGRTVVSIGSGAEAGSPGAVPPARISMSTSADSSSDRLVMATKSRRPATAAASGRCQRGAPPGMPGATRIPRPAAGPLAACRRETERRPATTSTATATADATVTSSVTSMATTSPAGITTPCKESGPTSAANSTSATASSGNGLSSITTKRSPSASNRVAP